MINELERKRLEKGDLEELIEKSAGDISNITKAARMAKHRGNTDTKRTKPEIVERTNSERSNSIDDRSGSDIDNHNDSDSDMDSDSDIDSNSDVDSDSDGDSDSATMTNDPSHSEQSTKKPLAVAKSSHSKQDTSSAKSQAEEAKNLQKTTETISKRKLTSRSELKRARNSDPHDVCKKAKLEEDFPKVPYKEEWPLIPNEYKRYGRQMILPQIGLQGQVGLKHSRALIVGLGGLGCPAAMYLAGAGIGQLGLMDGDQIETSNLHRQILYKHDPSQPSKVEHAKETLVQ